MQILLKNEHHHVHNLRSTRKGREFLYKLVGLFVVVVLIFYYLFIFGCVGSLLQSLWGLLPSWGYGWAKLLHGVWDLSSPTRVQTHIPCLTRQILNLWTTREVPRELFMRGKKLGWWEEGARNKRQDGLRFEWLVGAFWERNLRLGQLLWCEKSMEVLFRHFAG